MSNYSLAELEPLKLIIPIGAAAHDAAYQLSQLQPDDQKALQIYGNVLAVYGVHTYLELVGFESDLLVGDSFHPMLAMFGDLADLLLPGLGRLECRLVDQDAAVVKVPQPELERLGCVVLRMSGVWEDIEDLRELEIVGFTPTLAPEIAVASLAETDVLLALLQELSTASVLVRFGSRAGKIIKEMLRVSAELLPQLNFQTIAQKFGGFADDEEAGTVLMNWFRELLGDAAGVLAYRKQAQSQVSPQEQQVIRKLQVLCHDLAEQWAESIDRKGDEG
jgi:hypothetical protein